MSRHARVVALLAALASTGQASAKQSEADLIQRIEALQVDLEAARGAVTDLTGRLATEGAAARRGLTTTLQMGPLRVMTPHDQADLASRLFESVWREDFYGITGSPSLERSVFTFEWWRVQPSEVYVVALTDTDDLDVRRIEVAQTWVSNQEGLRAPVRDAIWTALRDDFPLGSPMQSWLGNARYVPYEDAYRTLAIQGTTVSRSCIAGDVNSCSTTLWPFATGPGRLSELFTPSQRQDMVRRAIQRWNAPADRQSADVIACIERADVASCDAVLARLWSEARFVTPSEVLVSALWHAVSVGGEGAWQRAIEEPNSSPPEVLARASGLGSEQLVAEWRTFLVGHRPSVYASLGRSALVASFWILILAGFAMRSTRWRLA